MDPRTAKRANSDAASSASSRDLVWIQPKSPRVQKVNANVPKTTSFVVVVVFFSSSFSFCSSPLVVVGAALLCRNNEDFEEEDENTPSTSSSSSSFRCSRSAFRQINHALADKLPQIRRRNLPSFHFFAKRVEIVLPPVFRFVPSEHSRELVPVPIGSCPTGTQYPADTPNSLFLFFARGFQQRKRPRHRPVPSARHRSRSYCVVLVVCGTLRTARVLSTPLGCLDSRREKSLRNLCAFDICV